ncbi:hypothetical protein KP509_07G004400 [Ceratopteris richardii]|uniref:K-box domain-containing protein n=1 Tax=Ceratopteris richardii TaxID=49495 RepID=A0A8T2UBW2_CERRI|nr:hypothetical protein KP509_07G004400 [Ceratopteris richardii]
MCTMLNDNDTAMFRGDTETKHGKGTYRRIISLRRMIIGFNGPSLIYWRHEAIKFRERIAYLEERHRYLNGENLGGLEMKDLHNLEDQIQAGVNKIRARKV